jgi:hypothetical protein
VQELTKNTPASSPWAFDLTVYLWLPSSYGDFTAGPFNKTSDPSFINILEKQRNFPMSFNGHFEAHYERYGLYLDGNYFGLDFEPHFDQGYTKGLSTRLGIMDYGISYRLLGSTASERVSNWNKKSTSLLLDVYVGGRTFWLGNEANIGLVYVSMNQSVSAPVIGSRLSYDITPKWYASLDGSVGGFGVDNVNFTGTGLLAFGYRTHLFSLPASVEAGYKVLNVQVNKPHLNTDITLNGPYIGLKGSW